jgi:glycosyltransferase involved in cell wall biosynthesis
MLNGNKIIVVLPAYNAGQTLEKTYREIPFDIVDQVILVDDSSIDATIELAQKLGIKTFIHSKNIGYGANQKTCYTKALEEGADIVVMVHPDYQYTPKLITALASMVASGEFDIALASRILGVGALKGGMPLYKYVSNRFLSAIQNLLINYKLSEYHTGFRAYSREVLVRLPLMENSNDFVFDNQILTQAIYFGYRIGEISCPTRYDADSSSISFGRSTRYGLGVLRTSFQLMLQRAGLKKYVIFDISGRGLIDYARTHIQPIEKNGKINT